MGTHTGRTVLKCHKQHHGEEDNEQEWSQNAALLSAVSDIKIWGHFTVFNDNSSHALMKGSNDVNEVARAADL